MKKYYSTLNFHFEQRLVTSPYKDFMERYPNGQLRWEVYTNRGKIGEINQYRDNYGRRKLYYSVTSAGSGYRGDAATLFEAKQLIAEKYKEAPESGTNIVSYLADPNAEFFPTPSTLAGTLFTTRKHLSLSEADMIWRF